MANEILGVDVLIYTDEDEPIAGQRSCDIKLNGDSIDTTTKDNGNWKTNTTGLMAWSISLDMVEYMGQKGKSQAEFMERMLKRETVQVKAVQKGRLVFEGIASISSKNIGGSHNDISTGAYELLGASEPTIHFVPFIKSISGSGTDVSIVLTQTGAEVEGSADLAQCITIGGTAPSAATLSGGTISCTVTSVTGGEKVVIKGGSLKNGPAVQVADLESIVPAA